MTTKSAHNLFILVREKRNAPPQSDRKETLILIARVEETREHSKKKRTVAV